jgi:diphthamide synthase (EF-2-diphthine--ammonia ligase)
MHGVRRELIAEQAAALGLPVSFVVIPSAENPHCPMAHTTPGTTFPPNDVYSTAMLAEFDRLKAQGIEVIAFGDIFLEDLRAYRDRLLAQAGLVGSYPLWGVDTAVLYAEIVALGFSALTVCVDKGRLSEYQLGRRLDEAFRDSLPAEVDPCGERGEYHSFTFDGPLFKRPVPFALGESITTIHSLSKNLSQEDPDEHSPACHRRHYPLGRITPAFAAPAELRPITALEVFGAVRYGNRWTAFVAPLLALFASDLVREVLYRYGLAEQWEIYPGPTPQCFTRTHQ